MKTFAMGECGYMQHYQTSYFKQRIVTNGLISQITSVVNDGFGKQGDEKDIEAHVFDSESIGLAYEGSRLMGFATVQNYSEINLCYLHGVAVAVTGKGVGSLLVRHMCLESGMDLLGFTTQNPAMYLSAKKYTTEIYPNSNNFVSKDIVSIARKITIHRQGVFRDDLVIEDLYSDCLYPQIPVPQDQQLWKWWKDKLSLDVTGKGRNGFVCIGKIRK